MKIIAENKEARFEYFVEDTFEAGISLDGGEVKSVRDGNVNLKDSFCSIYNGEVILKNAHIAVYGRGGAFNSKNSKRERRLLLHKCEINKLIGKINEKGYTLVPLKMYFKQSLIKLELGLCKGKNIYDKKQTLKEKDISRTTERDIKNFY